MSYIQNQNRSNNKKRNWYILPDVYKNKNSWKRGQNFSFYTGS